MFLCVAAVVFVTLEGQHIDIHSNAYMHYVTLMEEAFSGQHYREWVWVLTSEMEQCAIASVYVCVLTAESMLTKPRLHWMTDGWMSKW